MTNLAPAKLAEHWLRGLVNPRTIHLQETRDGVPETLDLGGERAGIAICRAWLTGEPLDAAEQGRFARCSACLDVRGSLPYAQEASR
jgi:hypothetical protein